PTASSWGSLGICGCRSSRATDKSSLPSRPRRSRLEPSSPDVSAASGYAPFERRLCRRNRSGGEVSEGGRSPPPSGLDVRNQEVVHPGRPGESSGCQVITHPGQEAWMNVHKNARLTVRRRQELVTRLEAGEPLKHLARVFAVSPRTVRKWRARYQDAGVAGRADRSSRPQTSPRRTPARLQLAAKVLRRQQWTCGQIAAALEVSAATVARVLRRCGLSAPGRLTPPPVVQRYEHAAVGDLVHLDSKKLGRIRGLGHRITGQRFHRFSGSGWESLHIAVDDHSRVAYVELLPDERQESARSFLRGALRWFRAHGVRVRRILTDNGSAYRSRGFRATCRALRVIHRRTRPYTPRTN